jgi:uncharacterized FlaG/YvyC family protein
MALDVSSIQTAPPQYYEGGKHQQSQLTLPGTEEARPHVSLVKAVNDLQQMSVTFNTRLSFSLNEKLDQIVVKVIENGTDKIVREIPPSELQQVYERIREVIGLLFDESA